MVRCAELIDNEVSCDFIDVNMGCLIDGVCVKGVGSSFMCDIDWLKNVVWIMVVVFLIFVIIKFRMGYFDDFSKYVAYDIILWVKVWGVFVVILYGCICE